MALSSALLTLVYIVQARKLALTIATVMVRALMGNVYAQELLVLHQLALQKHSLLIRPSQQVEEFCYKLKENLK